VKISVIGATGRMGQLALRLIETTEDLSLHSALASQSDLQESLGADLLIDLTRPEVSERVVDFALEHDLRLLVGTSGWTEQRLGRIEQKIKQSAATVLIIPNFSIGSVLATRFVAEASKYFDSIEIIETHHPKKLDAPSGTALFTAQQIAKARCGKALSLPKDHAELFSGVPIRSQRIEGAHAEQEVLLSQPNESLFVKHEVSSHEVYSKGILLAIRKSVTLTGLTVGLLPLLEEN
jgi:4-hydroxy-tetrahydrodipicolinate reductase